MERGLPEEGKPQPGVASAGRQCLITACILARNEERRLEDARRSLQGWTGQVIVLDHEREDRTAKIARRYPECVLPVPRPQGGCFDALRNHALPHAQGSWLIYLDADERVPPRLGAELRRLVRKQGDRFEALQPDPSRVRPSPAAKSRFIPPLP